MTLGWIDIACYSSETIGMIMTLVTIKSLDKPLQLLGAQIVLGFLMDIGWGIPTTIMGLPNGWLYNVYLFLEFLLVNSAVALWIHNKRVKKAIQIAVITMLVFIIIQLWKAPNSINSSMMTGAYLFNSFMFLYLIFEKFKTNELVETLDPIVWILFIKILFFMMQIPSLTLPREACTPDNGMNSIINNINGLANVIHYAGIGICFLIIHKKKQLLLKKHQNA